MREDSGPGTIITAFVLGALTGAAVALLMAPQTGEETRRMLGDKAREGADRAAEAARQGREFAEPPEGEHFVGHRARARSLQQARGTAPAPPPAQGGEPL